MHKRVILYSTHFTIQEQENLKLLKICNQTCLCSKIKDIAKHIGKEICLLLVSPKDYLSNRDIYQFLPKNKAPQIFNLSELKELKQKYYKKVNFKKHYLGRIDSFLNTIKIPATELFYNYLKYSIYFMTFYKIEEFSYKLLKFMCCMLNKDYSHDIIAMRAYIHQYLKIKNSKYLNLILRRNNNKIYVIKTINYCFQKFKNNEKIFSDNKPDYFKKEYYINKKLISLNNEK